MDSRMSDNDVGPEGLAWERITRAAWAVNPDWSKRERQAIEDFILTVRCYIALVDRSAPAPEAAPTTTERSDELHRIQSKFFRAVQRAYHLHHTDKGVLADDIRQAVEECRSALKELPPSDGPRMVRSGPAPEAAPRTTLATPFTDAERAEALAKVRDGQIDGFGGERIDFATAYLINRYEATLSAERSRAGLRSGPAPAAAGRTDELIGKANRAADRINIRGMTDEAIVLLDLARELSTLLSRAERMEQEIDGIAQYRDRLQRELSTLRSRAERAEQERNALIDGKVQVVPDHKGEIVYRLRKKDGLTYAYHTADEALAAYRAALPPSPDQKSAGQADPKTVPETSLNENGAPKDAVNPAKS